jgi:hypothetical protein
MRLSRSALLRARIPAASSVDCAISWAMGSLRRYLRRVDDWVRTQCGTLFERKTKYPAVETLQDKSSSPAQRLR